MPRRREEDQGGLSVHAIDGSGRITLNADQLSSLGRVMYVLHWIDPCLRLATEEALARLKTWVEEAYQDPLLQDWILRRTVSTARRVTVDDNGRIRIPYKYLDRIGLDGHGKTALLLPLREGIYEIWNPKTYDDVVLGTWTREIAYRRPDLLAEPGIFGEKDGPALPSAGDGS
ncbi:MAG: hypothetical protein N2512_06965 [Armatimonadetes bacterium]|nr:hypothetical protein [Armatimonadota bacterium]